MVKFKSKEEFFDFSKLLVAIPINEIVRLLEKFDVRIPLYVHRFLVKETIRTEVFSEKLYNDYTDEQKYRLRGYDNFSIFLLEKMISDYNLNFDVAKYKEMLLNLIYLNKEALVIKDNFFADLEQLQHSYAVDMETLSYHGVREIMDRILYEQNGFLDGIEISEWDDELLTSYTLGDLRALGTKYGVKIPRRINKTTLVEMLTHKFRLSDDEKELLEIRSVLDLEIYAKENGFKISIDLKKTDMIEFIKYSLGMYDHYPKDDFFDYHIPLASDEEVVEEDIIEEKEDTVYTEEIHDEVETLSVEEIIEEETASEMTEEETVEEEPVEEVTEEEPVEEVIEEESTKEEPEPIVKEEPVEEEPEAVVEQEVEEEIMPEEEPKLADASILSPEEKELLDEKINLIIKKYYKKRHRRIAISIIVIILILAVGGWAFYTYLWPLITG
ncbi:MAG: hypothetical protein WCY80_05560 [Candidatus Izemoplasmatales bacterium]